MSNTTGRTGANVRHLRHVGSKDKGTPGNTRADRRDLLRESMRDLDAKEADFFAGKPFSSIVRADTHLNVAMVNNGDGTFRRPKSIDEVLAYGDARIDNVFRKWNPNSFETTLIVVHLPKSMCIEIPNYYPILDKESGDPVLDANGEPMMRSRWVARDRAEVLEYFNEALGYYSTDVLTGGVDAIHGYDINFDESTPHIQIMADTLAPDPKHDGKLRVEASQMWGSHRDVTEVRRDKDGVEREMIELPKRKMSRYQAGLRDRMVALKYPVEAEYDPERHLSGSGNDEYGEVMDAKRIAEDRRAAADTIEVQNMDDMELIATAKKRNDDRAAKLDQREASLAQERASFVSEKADAADAINGAQAVAQRLREDAELDAEAMKSKARAEGVAEGRAEGYEAGRVEGRAEGRAEYVAALGEAHELRDDYAKGLDLMRERGIAPTADDINQKRRTDAGLTKVKARMRVVREMQEEQAIGNGSGEESHGLGN